MPYLDLFSPLREKKMMLLISSFEKDGFFSLQVLSSFQKD